MENSKLNFAKNFTATASIEDLEKLGWEFNHDETANAMDVSVEEAEAYNKENYDIQITVNEDGATLWRFVHNAKNVDCDNEATGDDEATIQDLKKLHAEGKLWNEKNI